MSNFFSAEESDAFTEIFNTGAGKATLAISELLDAPIAFAGPFCVVLPLDEATSYFQHRFGTDMCIISQGFSGRFGGATLLMFRHESSLKLSQAAPRTNEAIEAITEMECEALTEIGNIILNRCLSSISDLLEHEMVTSLPRYAAGTSGAILHNTHRFDLVLIVKVDFTVEGRNIEGYVTFIMNVDSVSAFRHAANQLLEKLN